MKIIFFNDLYKILLMKIKFFNNWWRFGNVLYVVNFLVVRLKECSFLKLKYSILFWLYIKEVVLLKGIILSVFFIWLWCRLIFIRNVFCVVFDILNRCLFGCNVRFRKLFLKLIGGFVIFLWIYFVW